MRPYLALILCIALLPAPALANDHLWFDTKDGPAAKSATAYWGESKRVPVYIRHNYTFARKLDVVMVVDVSGSMSDDLSKLREQWNSIIGVLSTNSNNDYRIAFIPYSGMKLGVREDMVTKFLSGTAQLADINQFVDALPSKVGGGGGCREYTHEPLDYILNRRWTGCYGDTTPCGWREGALKLVYVITDAGVDPLYYDNMQRYAAAFKRQGIFLFGITADTPDKSPCPPTCQCKGGGSVCSDSNECCSAECSSGRCTSPIDACYDLAQAAPATGGQYYTGFHISGLDQHLAKAFEDIDFNVFKVTLGAPGPVTVGVEGLDACPGGEGRCATLEVGECRTAETYPCGKLFYLNVTAPSGTSPQAYAQTVTLEVQGTGVKETVSLSVDVKVPVSVAADLRAIFDEGRTYVFFSAKNTGSAASRPRTDRFTLSCNGADARLYVPGPVDKLDAGDSLLGVAECTDVVAVDEPLSVKLVLDFGDSEQERKTVEQSLTVASNPQLFTASATYHPAGARLDTSVSGSGLEYAIVRLVDRTTGTDAAPPKKRTSGLGNISLSAIPTSVIDGSDVVVYAKAGSAFSRRRATPGYAYFEVEAPGSLTAAVEGWTGPDFIVRRSFDALLYANVSVPVRIATVKDDTFTVTVDNRTTTTIKPTDESKKLAFPDYRLVVGRRNGTYDRLIELNLTLPSLQGTREVRLAGTRRSTLLVALDYRIKYPFTIEAVSRLSIIPRRSGSFKLRLVNGQESADGVALCAWGEGLAASVEGKAVSERTCYPVPSLEPGAGRELNLTVSYDRDAPTSLVILARSASRGENRNSVTIPVTPASFTQSTMSASCERRDTELRCHVQLANSGNLATTYFYGFAADGFVASFPFEAASGVRPGESLAKTIKTEFLPYEAPEGMGDVLIGLGRVQFMANLVLKDANFSRTRVLGALDTVALVGALESRGQAPLAALVKAFKDSPSQQSAAAFIDGAKTFIDSLVAKAKGSNTLTSRTELGLAAFVADSPVLVEGKLNASFSESQHTVPFSLMVETELEVPDRVTALSGEQAVYNAKVKSTAAFPASFDIVLAASYAQEPIATLENKAIEAKGVLPVSIPIPTSGVPTGEHKLYLKTRPHGAKSYSKSASSVLEVTVVRIVDLAVEAENASVRGPAREMPPFVFSITNKGTAEETFTISPKTAKDKVTIEPPNPLIRPNDRLDVKALINLPPDATKDFEAAVEVVPRSAPDKAKTITFTVDVQSPAIRVEQFPSNLTELGALTFFNDGDGPGVVSVSLAGLNSDCVTVENGTLTLAPKARGTVTLRNGCPEAGTVMIKAEAEGLSESRDLSIAPPAPAQTPTPVPSPKPSPPPPPSSSRTLVVALVVLALGAVGLVIAKQRKAKGPAVAARPGAAVAAAGAQAAAASAWARKYPYQSNYMNSRYGYYQQGQQQAAAGGMPGTPGQAQMGQVAQQQRR